MSKRLELLDQAIAAGSMDPFHHYARALELRSLGRTEDALSALEQVGESFAEYVPTYLMAAQLALELGRSEAARDWAERGVVRATAAGEEHALSEIRALLQSL